VEWVDPGTLRARLPASVVAGARQQVRVVTPSGAEARLVGAFDVLPGAGPLLGAAASASAASVEVGEELRVLVHVANEGDLPADVSPSMATGGPFELVAAPDAFTLAPGEAATLTWRWRATAQGEALFEAVLTAPTPAGTTVTASASVAAEALAVPAPAATPAPAPTASPTPSPTSSPAPSPSPASVSLSATAAAPSRVLVGVRFDVSLDVVNETGEDLLVTPSLAATLGGNAQVALLASPAAMTIPAGGVARFTWTIRLGSAKKGTLTLAASATTSAGEALAAQDVLTVTPK
jgi:hypothetical protein